MGEDEGSNIHIEFVNYPQFENFRILLKNVVKNETVAVKWIRENGFIPKDRVEDCPRCIILKAAGKVSKIGKLAYYKAPIQQRRKGNIQLNYILKCI